MKLEASINDGVDLKQQLELKAQENKNLSNSLISLREANSELEVRPLFSHNGEARPTRRPSFLASVQNYFRGNRGWKESRRVSERDGESTKDDGCLDGRV